MSEGGSALSNELGDLCGRAADDPHLEAERRPVLLGNVEFHVDDVSQGRLDGLREGVETLVPVGGGVLREGPDVDAVTEPGIEGTGEAQDLAGPRHGKHEWHHASIGGVVEKVDCHISHSLSRSSAATEMVCLQFLNCSAATP